MCRHTHAMGHNYNCACDEATLFDCGGSLLEQGKKYELYILEWCLTCGAVRTNHGNHKGLWDRPGYMRTSGMRKGKRESIRWAVEDAKRRKAVKEGTATP